MKVIEVKNCMEICEMADSSEFSRPTDRSRLPNAKTPTQACAVAPQTINWCVCECWAPLQLALGPRGFRVSGSTDA